MDISEPVPVNRVSRVSMRSARGTASSSDPDGINRGWNDGRPRSGRRRHRTRKGADRRFLARYPIDQKRIYVTGFSNGAMFSQYLGCPLAPQIAAMHRYPDYMPTEDVAGCRPARPISVIEMGGAATRSCPPGGGSNFSASIAGRRCYQPSKRFRCGRTTPGAKGRQGLPRSHRSRQTTAQASREPTMLHASTAQTSCCTRSWAADTRGPAGDSTLRNLSSAPQADNSTRVK